MLKWFRIIMGVLLAIISILWAMTICGEHDWGIIICLPIAVGIFILLYGFFWLCMFTAEKITNAFAKVYHEKVVPRTQQAAIDKYKEENPHVIPIVPEEKVNIEDNKIQKTQDLPWNGKNFNIFALEISKIILPILYKMLSN